MSRLKLKRRNFAAAAVALSLVAALFSSCARPETTTGNTGDAGQRESKPLANEDETDRALAAAAAEALGDREGAVLVMDPGNGRLRAVVNPRLAFEQAFPPGSTIKSFTALAAMRAGLTDRESRTFCPGRFTGESIDVVCSHPKSKAPFNLAQALAYSCNYFFATLGGRLSFDAFKATLASAGMGSKTGVNASGESAGMLRDGDWRVRDLLGEGDNLLVTPVQLLVSYCALVNDGHVFRPQMSVAEKFAPEERAGLHIEPSHRAALIEGMRGAVVYGTAEKSGLGSLPLFIFGKTGTSTASNGFRRQGWFVSFAADASSAVEVTAESLELAVLVFIKRSHGSDAAAVSRRVFEEYSKLRRNAAAGQAGEQERAGDKTERAGGGRRGDPRSLSLGVKLLSENRVIKLTLEDYVLGVLSVEAAVEDESEALKAQAVVSRTYALKNLGRHEAEGFDLCSNTHCQQYVSPDGRASDKLRRAVADTAGEALGDASGQVADAYFHAACGGVTANIESLWGVRGPSYLRGVRDDYCATMPNRDWTDEIPAGRLAHALASDPLTDAGRTLDEIVVTKRDATGRAEIISIEGERRRRVRGWDFKIIVGRALGWNLLKSSRFSVSRRGSSFIFRGSGFGHGLGLCQNGAHVMARRGATYRQILDHYFPGTRVLRSERVVEGACVEGAPTGRVGDVATRQVGDVATRRVGDAFTESRRDEMFIVAGRYRRLSSVGAKCADSKFTNTQQGHFAPTELEHRAHYVPINIPLLRSWTALPAGPPIPISATPRRSFAAVGLTPVSFHPGSFEIQLLTLSSKHFRVSYPATFRRCEIEAALRTLEAARLDMLARVNPESLFLSEGTLDVVIHETTQGFIAATGQPWWVAGATRGRHIELQPLDVLRRRRILNSTLRHEYAHAVMETIGQGRTPRWLAEGLAVSFAGEGASLERFRPKMRLAIDELERRLAAPRSAAEMRSLYAAAYLEIRSLIQKEGELSVWRRITSVRGPESRV